MKWISVEKYFDDWWIPKELPEGGFNKTAMLDFAEMYHNRLQNLSDKGWVEVSEQLPDSKNNDFSNWVLAIDSAGYMFKTRYDYKYDQWMNKASVPDNKVTHWMELPKPPQEL